MGKYFKATLLFQAHFPCSGAYLRIQLLSRGQFVSSSAWSLYPSIYNLLIFAYHYSDFLPARMVTLLDRYTGGGDARESRKSELLCSQNKCSVGFQRLKKQLDDWPSFGDLSDDI